ncbi:MAG TPA: serine/threonine-protein kinase [Polyangiaceae bacterium]|nr:serine/threonine-protein kinase [Polyangiaceae bacterium]
MSQAPEAPPTPAEAPLSEATPPSEGGRGAGPDHLAFATESSSSSPPPPPLALTLPPTRTALAKTTKLGRAPAGHAFGAGKAIKHYEIIRQLGQGGMGAVYLARDTKLGRLVAIKLLLERGDPSAESVLVEARATARCKHENIVVVYEVGEHEGAPYLVLEYVEGSTLRAWMAQRARAAEGAAPTGSPPGPVPPTLAAELMVPVVRALACAHEQGIVHRDLKPENILLADAGHVKVVDFGIAKQVDVEPLSRGPGPGPPAQTGPLGTSLYMAPEQWRGEAFDPRVDLWAVGVILYELCAGVHPLAPFTPGRLAQVGDWNAPMPSLRDVRPDAGALADVVERCLRKRPPARYGSARELLAELEALVAGRAGPSAGEEASPFTGLSAFQESDAGRFFGRAPDVASMVRMLRSQPLLSVVGASGAGKSSFVRAGVIAALKRSGERWESFVVRPGRRPLAALAEVLAQVAEAPRGGEGAGVPAARGLGEIAAALRSEPGQLGAQLRARCRQRRGKALLFVDQFEELYTLGVGAEERGAFLACLEGAADDASSPLRVVLALRADFLERMADDRRLLAEVTRGLVLLSPMGREGLREALVRPLEAAGYRFEGDALVDRMLDALGGTRSPLPLLQFTATKLWEARDRARHLLTEASYERLGGVAGALSAHADAVLAGLSAREQRLCREVLVRLVTPERTRAVVRLDELRGAGQGGEGDAGPRAVESVVQRLVDARLLSLEMGGEDATVELVHESLIDRWPELGRWLDESEQDAQFLARLRAAAQQWEASGRAAGLLWREGAALEARAWLSRRPPGQGDGLGERERRYLDAVVALSERSRRLRRWAVVGLVGALSSVALGVSLLMVRANREAVLARNATRVATARERQADPTTVLALLRELEPPDLPRGWATMVDGALRKGVARVMLTHPDVVLTAAWSPDGRHLVSASVDRALRVWRADGTGEPRVLRGHDDSIYAAAWSPDGRRLVSASKDTTLRVWPADGAGEPLVLRGHEAPVLSAAFSPDGRRVVSASRDGTLRVWPADGAAEARVLRGHEGPVWSAAFSPDGTQIVSASDDMTLRVWRADGSGEPRVLRGHEGWVYSVAFSPDGRRIVSASADKTLRVWRADGVGEVLVLRGHEGEILSTAWSADGRRILSASDDKTVRVWRADGAGEPLVLRGHEGYVNSAAFSPDGRQVASASDDKTLRVWPADGAGQPVVLRAHPEQIVSVAWCPDGRRVVTASDDKTAQIWGADGSGEPRVLKGHEEAVLSAAFSPDGRRVVTASDDKTARVWDAESGSELRTLLGHEARVSSAAFSPDGRRVATASHDKTLRVWPADGAGEPLVLRGHEGALYSVAWSPDGRRIVTGSHDKTARVWPADGRGEPVVLRGHEQGVRSVAFSPDGRRVATASWDKTARVWPADGAGEPLVLRGHENMVHGVAFSPDGALVATASQDRSARLWRADGTGEPLVLRHEAPVNAVALSPDGKRLVIGSDDGSAWIWSDLGPPRAIDDRGLWAATTYCLPVERRVELLNVSEAQARADERACRRRVDEAREATRD